MSQGLLGIRNMTEGIDPKEKQISVKICNIVNLKFLWAPRLRYHIFNKYQSQDPTLVL